MLTIRIQNASRTRTTLSRATDTCGRLTRSTLTLFFEPQPTWCSIRTTVDCWSPGIQCCRPTNMEQPTGSDNLSSQTQDIFVSAILFPVVVLAVAYYLGHFKNFWLIDWLIDWPPLIGQYLISKMSLAWRWFVRHFCLLLFSIPVLYCVNRDQCSNC